MKQQLNFQTAIAATLRTITLVVIISFFTFCAAFSQGTWVKKADFPDFPEGKICAVGFSIGTKGYRGTGMFKSAMSNYIYSDFWEWDQVTNVWTQKASFGGGDRVHAVGFSIGNKGYIGTGMDYYSVKNDFWEWDQATNTWVQKASLPVGRTEAIGFSIGSKGYIGTGGDGANIPQNDFYEWNQATNTWTKKANFSGAARLSAVGFSIAKSKKGYVGTGAMASSGLWGTTSGPLNDFWEWDQATDTWTQKANFGGSARWGAIGFPIANKGYVGLSSLCKGSFVYGYTDFWEWDQTTDVWIQKANYPGCAGLEVDAVGFSIGCHGYISGGRQGQKVFDSTGAHVICKDLWEYTPSPQPTNCCVLVAGISGPDTVCIGKNTPITASGGSNYSWSTGASSATIIVNQSVTATYTVIVSDANGCSDIAVITVPVKNCCLAAPAINSDPAPNTTFCVGQNVYLAASGGTSYVWNTGDTGANIAATLSVTTTYSVTATDAAGCTGTASTTFIVDPNCTTTGTGRFNNGSLQSGIWPNPSNGIFTLDMAHNMTADAGIEIFNVFGEKIYQSAVSGRHQTVDISHQSKGIYMLKLTWGKETSFAKIIIRQ